MSPAARPADTTPLGERLAERTAPLAPADQANGWTHLVLCEGMMRGLRQVAEVYDPPDPIPPGAPLLSPWLCPEWALPWLAQLVGASIPSGTAPADARVLISSVSGWKRGTPDALRAAAALYLTGSRTVFFRERAGGNAYHLEVITLDSETPNPQAVYQAVLSQKPGGLILDVHQVLAWDWEQVVTDEDTWATVQDRYSDWRHLYGHEPDLGG